MDWATLFGNVQTEINGALNAVIPLAAAIFGTLAAVGIGIRVFRKVGAR